MKHINFAKLTLAVAAVLAISNLAAAQLMIDNFSTGTYQKTLKTGTDTHTETGEMLGGSRQTFFGMVSNEFDQPSSFQVKGKTKSSPSALIFNSGYKTNSDLLVYYGLGSPMNVDLSSSYDRFRLYFDGTDQNINFNIEVTSGGTTYSLACNIIPPAYMQSFTVDYPFAAFGGDLDAVTDILLEIGVAEGANAELDYGIDSVQAVSGGQADVTCPN